MIQSPEIWCAEVPRSAEIWCAVTCWQFGRPEGRHVEPVGGPLGCALPGALLCARHTWTLHMTTMSNTDLQAYVPVCWVWLCPQSKMRLHRAAWPGSLNALSDAYEALMRPSRKGETLLVAKKVGQHSSLCPDSHMRCAFLHCLQTQQEANNQPPTHSTANALTSLAGMAFAAAGGCTPLPSMPSAELCSHLQGQQPLSCRKLLS